MKKVYKLDFQKIRRKTQVKDFISFELYLKNIFSDIAKREWKETEQKGIDKLSFIEYMNIPFIVGEKLFNAFDKNKKGFLTKNEFVNGIISLYVGDLEETQKMIFSILDFDSDGIIIPEDSRLLISFIKNISEPPSTIIKQKLLRRNTITDEENLDELNELINNFFNFKSQMTFEEYKYNIENINSDVFFVFIYFLYDNKPFSDSAIKILKLFGSTGNNLTSSFSSSVMNSSSEDCTVDSSKFRVKSPSNTFKNFIYDLIDVDIEEIERECIDNNDLNINDDNYNDDFGENIEEDFNLLNEQLIEIKIPQLNYKIDIKEKKSDKDYPSQPNFSGISLNDKLNINNFENFNSKIKINKFSEFNNKITKSTFSDDKDIKKEFMEEKSEKNLTTKALNNLKITDNVSINNNISINCPKSMNVQITSDINKEIEKKKFDKTIDKNLNENNNSYKFVVGNLKELKDEDQKDKNIKKSDIVVSTSSSTIKINSKINNNNSNLLDNFNDNISNKSATNASKQINSSNILDFDTSKRTNKGGPTANEFINQSDVLYEGFIFKSRSNNKLKRYYLVLIGMDLFYFSNSKRTKLKGMHNLSGTHVFEEGELIKVREESKSKKTNNNNQNKIINYYPFKLYFKKKSRMYYCPNEEESKNWIKFIRNVTKFRDINDYYTFEESLGKGKFGNVKLGIDKSNKNQVAIKTINKANLKGIETEMVKTETEIMRFCRHKNIVRLIDNFEDLNNIYIVLEFLSGGNLNNFLSEQQTILPEKKIKEIIYQIGTGINYLHHFGILHRDLKPENLMMSNKNHQISIVKIVDFGLSKILGVTEKSNDAYGTLSYAAPEVIQKNNYSTTVDIWSMGVILFFLVCGYLPFNDKNNDVSKIAKDITKANVKFDDSIWEDFSPYARELTMKCLERDLNKRINIKDFLEHQWFDDIWN